MFRAANYFLMLTTNPLPLQVKGMVFNMNKRYIHRIYGYVVDFLGHTICVSETIENTAKL